MDDEYKFSHNCLGAKQIYEKFSLKSLTRNLDKSLQRVTHITLDARASCASLMYIHLVGLFACSFYDYYSCAYGAQNCLANKRYINDADFLYGVLFI